MADVSNTEDGPIFRLVYRSRLSIPPDDVEAEVATILSAARTKNPRLGITGALVVWEDSVVQTLEGDETVARASARWSMARVSDGADADIPLSKQWEGGIDVSAPRLTTPDEDAVVASMRDRVRGAPA